MKNLVMSVLAMFTLLTAVKPVFAAGSDDSTSRTTLPQDTSLMNLSDFDLHINPQIGMSSFEYSGDTGGAHSKLSGGATVELGHETRMLETGFLVLGTGSDALLPNGSVNQISSTYLAIPMLAKLRVLSMESQAWYVKFGFITMMQLQTNDHTDTNPMDVLGSVGMGSRFKFTQKADFIVEATYNRGLMDAMHGTDSNYNQGFLLMAGLSFKL